MRPKSKRSPLAIFTFLFLLAMLSLSAIVVSAANTSAPPFRPSTAGDWPMYGHDVSRTNYNPDETTISAANVAQLVSRWQHPFGTGSGTPTSSAPVVSNGKVFVGTNLTSGNNFFALDATTGVQAWAANLGYYNTCFNVGIGSTAAISGSTVVVGGGDQPSVAYYGLDANTGAQLWRVPINAGASAFSWASPLISPSGRTYFGVSSRCDNPSVRGEVRGLDYTTGLNPASAYFVNAGAAGGGVWNSPALSPDGTILVAATGEDYSCTPNCNLVRSMVTMDPSTMAILQSNKQGQDNVDQDWGSTPLIFHDSQNRVLVGAHLKSGGATPNFFTYVISDVNSGPIWQRNTSLSTGMMDAYDPTIGNGGTLFIFGGSNTLYAVDPATGANSLWPPISVGGNSHGNMALANGLIFLNLGSTGLQIRSEATGTLLRTLTPANPGSSNSGVAVSNGFIYWYSGQYLNAWSLPDTGTPTPGTPTATPIPSSTSTTPPTSTHTAVPTATNTATHTSTLVPTATHTGVLPTSTSTSVPTNTSVATSTRTSTAIATSTAVSTTTNTNTPLPTQTPGGSTATTVPTDTSTATSIATDTAVPTDSTATATATVCAISFEDVPTGSTFYQYIQCMACRGIINGYPCGGPGEPCDGNNDPYFRPGNNVSRGQFSKIASNAAGFSEPAGAQQYEDVLPGSTFYDYIWRLSNRGFVTGYPCGSPGEPCNANNDPYFRPGANITRGQLSKIDSNTAGFNDTPGAQQYEDIMPGTTFYDYIWRLSSRGIVSGYPCGGPGEPCSSRNLPYFRFNNSSTRGQASKIVSNTFFPACSTQ